ncbi:uncharacterized protein BDZ99DRAFT_476122 [Mytilinidion resinicola]|uniref:Uncharacterized protein n=1 Tax=Mytilinidion resinicola TaxID=574789 RepID=A0A6A6YM62_9PEZI|nr:uncharacterized protein BDZ99DRAFT_476122 [Mytilinidion resinicola]KAF2809880.1 hypothetical protein BDZ99DRAFT_476122 [Mytilinidion resinicola]
MTDIRGIPITLNKHGNPIGAGCYKTCEGGAWSWFPCICSDSIYIQYPSALFCVSKHMYKLAKRVFYLNGQFFMRSAPTRRGDPRSGFGSIYETVLALKQREKLKYIRGLVLDVREVDPEKEFQHVEIWHEVLTILAEHAHPNLWLHIWNTGNRSSRPSERTLAVRMEEWAKIVKSLGPVPLFDRVKLWRYGSPIVWMLSMGRRGMIPHGRTASLEK